MSAERKPDHQYPFIGAQLGGAQRCLDVRRLARVIEILTGPLRAANGQHQAAQPRSADRGGSAKHVGRLEPAPEPVHEHDGRFAVAVREQTAQLDRPRLWIVHIGAPATKAGSGGGGRTRAARCGITVQK